MMTAWWARALQGILAGLDQGRRGLMAGWGDTSLKISPDEFPDPIVDDAVAARPGEQSIILAGGCFWCIEAVYTEVEGVLGLTSGYAGGTAETADYETVCSGRTGHAEAVEVR